jgi:hypothetical protein
MTRSSISRTGARAAALALVLVASGPAITAYADDEYGTHHETLIRQAGSITRTASAPKQVWSPYDQFAVGENINFASPGREALIRRAAEAGRVGATASFGAARPEGATLR